ncbi:type IV pilin protein [Dyella sp. 20L07]|uniref:type IV pilin protein n=1 Tax=Dyella sp. 20L07 TaxID=3384240 RepID=UPI003D2C302E
MRNVVGFTLIEVMIVVAIVAILASIAYPSYVSHITRTNRVAAQGCLSELANFMERYYASNLTYNLGSTTYVQPDCTVRTNTDYDYPAPAVASTSGFTITAVPKGAQAKRDAQCGTLQLDQAGVRTVSGTASTAVCWR